MRRRDFIGSGLIAALLPGAACRAARTQPGAGIRFGYAALTWRNDDVAAIDDIATLGFRGIQLRAPALTRWGARPEELKELLASRELALVALSSGVMLLDPAAEAEDLALHVRNATFVRDVGGLYLQVVDQRPQGRAPVADDYRRMGRLLTELGRRTADLGVRLGYHNHMGNLGQAPEEVDRVLDAADPRFVMLELDTAHYQAAGGDPADAVTRHAGRLLFLHLKDLQRPVPGRDDASYRFVELGQGSVDFPAVFAALDRAAFDGWAVVELDPIAGAQRTPAESAALSKRYLEDLGFTI